jgi:hypothetical protein
MSCFIHFRACRAAATAAVLLLGVALLPPIASAAGLGALARNTESMSAGTWGTTESVSSMVFTGQGDQTSTVTNTGSIALSAESFSVTISRPTFFLSLFDVYECTVPWVGNNCSGGAGTQLGGTLESSSTTVVTSTSALAVGSSLYLQVEPVLVFTSTTVTISSQVTSPSQLRAAIRTNQ